MRIRRINSTFNFFESFSDLIFCTLVLFLVIVLFLVLNINRRAEVVQQAEQDVETRIVEIDSLEKEISDRAVAIERELEKILSSEQELGERSNRVATLQAKLQESEARLDKIFKAQRFTGHSGETDLMVMPYEDRNGRKLWYPLPVSINDEHTVSNVGATEQQERDRRDRIETEFFAYLNNEVEPLTPAMFRDVFLSLSQFMGQAKKPVLGLEFDLDNLEVKAVYEDQPADKAGIRVGDTVLAIDGESVSTLAELNEVKMKRDFGDTSTIQLLTANGSRKSVQVTYVRSRFPSHVRPQWSTYWSMRYMGHSRVTEDNRDVYEWITEGSFEADFLSSKIPDYNSDLARSTKISSGTPVLYFSIDNVTREILINNSRFSIKQFKLLLRSFTGAGVVVEYEARDQPDPILSDWVVDEVLVPTGFVNRSPDVPFLRE